MILGGENQTLDFKFEISNAQKIAKTLVAFANTDGGTLLIGVKDNGTIAGIRTEEEIYMIDSAANIFSRPKIEYSARPWRIDGKQIIEIKINKSENRPHKAKDFDNKWKSYIRVNDQIFFANKVIERSWKEKDERRVKIEYSRKEEFLLNYLKDYEDITQREFCKMAEITKKEAEDILVNFLILELIEFEVTDKEVFYSSKQ